MSLTRIVGDVHGKWNSYVNLVKNIDFNSIQVGDFGVGFAHGNSNKFVDNNVDTSKHCFIRGNHDNPTMCKFEMSGYISDGCVENGVMYIGGAWSIDWRYRTAGIDWWSDEECSYNELSTFIKMYENIKPRIMITHDCPSLAAYYMFVKNGNSIGGKSLHLTRTGEALQQMFEIHQPEFWFFGHWHTSKMMKINGTKFVCLDELDYIDIDFNNSDYTNKAIDEKFTNNG